jgi:hypothetical protein
LAAGQKGCTFHGCLHSYTLLDSQGIRGSPLTAHRKQKAGPCHYNVLRQSQPHKRTCGDTVNDTDREQTHQQSGLPLTYSTAQQNISY